MSAFAVRVVLDLRIVLACNAKAEAIIAQRIPFGPDVVGGRDVIDMVSLARVADVHGDIEAFKCTKFASWDGAEKEAARIHDGRPGSNL